MQVVYLDTHGSLERVCLTPNPGVTVAHPYLLLTPTISGFTTAVVGPSIGIQGQYNALGGQTKGLWERPIEVFIANTATSSTATVVIQTSVDGTTWVTWCSFAFTSVTNTVAQNTVGRMPPAAVYIRANVTAISGATIQAYLVLR